jgi:proteic killer suppression protein
MIRSYKDRRTAAFARGERVLEFESFRRQAEKRLRVLDAAQALHDLMRLPSNNFKALTGVRRLQYSIRINGRWRICFEWPEGGEGPENVEIIDYH